MNKQEFLAFSQPYKLYVIDDEINETFKVAGYREDSDELLIHDNIDGSVEEYCENLLKPILRPLSDLIKEIEHNGEKFIPIDRLNFLYDYTKIGYLYRYTTEYLNEVDWQSEPFEVVKKLIEWKFDIADFISTGEAIDLNTLYVNPYK